MNDKTILKKEKDLELYGKPIELEIIDDLDKKKNVEDEKK